MSVKLYYYHDPMCSWCWGFTPVWQQLQQRLKDLIEIEYVLGGLAPDNEQPMPLEMQQTIKGYWQKIEALLGTEFNYRFWDECKPKRSTYPACRAVIAAKEQGFELEMIKAIQEAYYLRAMNPSNLNTHLKLASELGLNLKRFESNLFSHKVNNELKKQIKIYRSYSSRGFPSLDVAIEGHHYPVTIDYKNSDSMYASIISLIECSEK